MLIRFYTATLFISLLSCQTGRGPSLAYTPTFTVTDTTTHAISEDQSFTFGYLQVPENRSLSNGRQIQLPVYIFKSRSATPKADPIIYTVGGPGSSTMPSAQYMRYYQYLDDRDIILVEQRGTQFAKPHLDCPEWAKAVHASRLPGITEAVADSMLVAATKNCRERLTRQGIDLNSYNTQAIAADINDLAQVLQLDSFNLLTISYSTKIAQVLLRDYPTRIRSVVMDSPLPLEVNYDEESVENFLANVEAMIKKCEVSDSCGTTFPALKQRFFDFLSAKSESPLVVEVINPISNAPATFNLDGADLALMLSEVSPNAVPTEIGKLLEGDLSSVENYLAGLFSEPGSGAGQGMRLSVWCTEEHPFSSQEVIAAETNKYPQTVGLSPAVFSKQICDTWGVKKSAPRENEAVKSDTPVLLISGEFDADTPPKWATAMQRNLPNSFHLIFQGWQHTPTTNWGDQCAMEAANAFFNDPEVRPEVECFTSGHSL